MNFFIDCEWSEDKQLISMALVPANGWPSFYMAVEYNCPGEWQLENVIPVLNINTVSYESFQVMLFDYLENYQSVHIIADWPEDIAMFCNALITGPGERIDTPPISMEVVRLDSVSLLPHNALADAKGFMVAYNEACF